MRGLVVCVVRREVNPAGGGGGRERESSKSSILAIEFPWKSFNSSISSSSERRIAPKASHNLAFSRERDRTHTLDVDNEQQHTALDKVHSFLHFVSSTSWFI